MSENIIGKTFERLKVIEKNEQLSSIKRKHFFKCICICGTHVSVEKHQLTRIDGKNTKSCGCLGGKRDLTGETFVRLKVLKKNNELSKSNKCTMYDCVCTCGTFLPVNQSQLTCGHTKSCGCLHREKASARGKLHKKNLLGLKFTKLLVIKEVGIAPSGHILWECLCDCKKSIVVEGYRLTRKNVQSCGCLLLTGRPRLDEEISGKRLILSRYRCRGLNEFGEFNLDEEIFFTLIKKPCFYCGEAPKERAIMKRKKTKEPLLFAYNGLDRINSQLGYFSENVVSCCSTCNTMKLDQEFNEFLNNIKKIYKNLNDTEK